MQMLENADKLGRVDWRVEVVVRTDVEAINVKLSQHLLIFVHCYIFAFTLRFAVRVRSCNILLAIYCLPFAFAIYVEPP